MQNDEELIRQWVADCDQNGRSSYPAKQLLAIIDHQRKEIKRLVANMIVTDT